MNKKLLSMATAAIATAALAGAALAEAVVLPITQADLLAPITDNKTLILGCLGIGVGFFILGKVLKTVRGGTGKVTKF